MLKGSDQFGFALHILLDHKLVRTLLKRDFVELALVFGMDDVVLFGEWIFSESLDMVGPQIPLLLLGHILFCNVALVVPNRHQHRVLGLALAVVLGGLVFELEVLVVVGVVYSLPDVVLVLLLLDELLLPLDAIVDGAHKHAGHAQGVVGVVAADVLDVG